MTYVLGVEAIAVLSGRFLGFSIGMAQSVFWHFMPFSLGEDMWRVESVL